MEITPVVTLLNAQAQISQASLALGALRQAAAAEAQVASLLAQATATVVDPASLLGRNIDTWA